MAQPELRFRLLLARSLGRTVAELEASMTAEEYGDWCALYLIDPWGPERVDFGLGTVAATVANVHRGKDSKPFTPADFMPAFTQPDKAEPEQGESPQDFIKRLRDAG